MEKGEKSLAIRSYDIAKPDQMLSMAKVLKEYVVKNNLYVNIVGKNYVEVEGWQFAGGLMGLFPRVVSVEDVSKTGEYKWLARVEIIDKNTQNVVGTGFAVCSNKEGKKKTFDEYAVLSMAQTRAIGKAYRNLIGWVMKLAGYEPTPAEDMPKDAVKVKEEKPTEALAQVDYKLKLYQEVLKISKKEKMTNQEVIDFLNTKIGTKVKSINGPKHAQILLAQLLQTK